MENPAPVTHVTPVSYSERQRGVSSKLRIFDTLVLRYRRISENTTSTHLGEKEQEEGGPELDAPAHYQPWLLLS